MGHLFSAPLEVWVAYYLKTLRSSSQDYYTLNKFETSFYLNKLPGSSSAPKCNLFVKNSSIRFQGLVFDGQVLNMESSKISIEIGEGVLRCDDLGYIFRVKGKLHLFDVHSSATLSALNENDFKVSDISSQTTVKKIEPNIELQVNGADHSRLANVLLSIDNPDTASCILNAILGLQKDNIKDFINCNLQNITGQFGL